jgi:hypothetical protein|tara:strand:- start:335 stop:778 length:444 start_codon:yes stop_codon:yes gene_type:complete
VTILRWILLLPTLVLVCLLVAAAATGIVSYADGQCAPRQMAAGVCVAPWHTTVMDAVIYGGMLIAAGGAVLAGALVAPRFKLAIAFAILVSVLAPLGAALFFARNLETPFPLPIGNMPDHLLTLIVLSTGIGLVCIWWIKSWHSSTS